MALLKQLKKELENKKELLEMLKLFKSESSNYPNPLEYELYRDYSENFIKKFEYNCNKKNLNDEILDFKKLNKRTYNLLEITNQEIRNWELSISKLEEKISQEKYLQLQRDVLEQDKESKKFQFEFLKTQKKSLKEEKLFREEIVKENRYLRNLTIILASVGVATILYFLIDLLTNLLEVNDYSKSLLIVLYVLLVLNLLFFSYTKMNFEN